MAYIAPTAITVTDQRALADVMVNELRRVADAIERLQAYGSVVTRTEVGSEIPLAIGLTPVKVPFTAIGASGRFIDVQPDLANDELIMRGGGVFHFVCDLEAGVNAGTDITIELYVNGERVGIRSAVDTSNQTTTMTFSAAGIASISELNRGARVDMRVSTAAPTSINIRRAALVAFRVGGT